MDVELTSEQKAALEKDISTIQKWVKKSISITKNELINSTNQMFKNLIIDIDESTQRINSTNDDILSQKKELSILHEKLQKIENEKKQLFEKNENLTKRLEASTQRNISEIQNNFDTKFQKQAENLVQENSDLKIEILNLKNKISSLTAAPVDFETTGDGDVFSELQNHFNHLAQEKEILQNQLSIEKQNAEMCRNKTDLARAENENLTILMDIMKSEYNELNQQISDYRQDFQDYESKLQDANKEIQASQDIIKELKNKNQSLSSEIEMKVKDNSENSKLKTEKEKLQSEKIDLLNLIDDFNKKQLNDKSQLSTLETQVYNYEKAILEKDNTISTLKSQLSNTEKQNQEMESKISQMKNQLLESYNEKEMLLKTQENTQKEVDLLKQSANNRSSTLIEGLNKQISDLMETQRALYSQIEYQQIEATAHKSQIEDLEHQLDETTSLLKNSNEGDKFESFSKKLEEMKIENDALHQKLIQNQDQMSKISEIETLKYVNKTLRQSQNELKTELINVKKELSKCTSEISSLKAQNNDITSHIEQLKPENVSLREKQQQLIKISQNVQESNRDLTRQNLEKDKKNKYLNEKLEKLSEELSISKTRNEELESLIRKHHIKVDEDDDYDDNDKNEDESQKIVDRSVKKDQQEKANEDTKNAEKVAKLLGEITKIKNEKKALRTRLLKIINMCKSLQKAKAEFIQEKEQLSKEIDQLQTDYMAINEKNSKLTTDNQKLRKKNIKLIVYAKQLKKTRQELTEKLNKYDANNNNEEENENEEENKNEKNNEKVNIDQSIQVTLQEGQISLVQEEEDINEIKRLNDKLNAKIIEIDKIKRQHKKEMNKLQKENNKLRNKQEAMQEKIKNQAKNHMNDDSNISEIKEAQMSDLRFQNDALKRKIELQAQNYELDILDLQTEIAQKDQEIKQLQENLMNNSEDNTEVQQLKVKNADLQSQISRLIQDKNRAGSRRGFYPDSSSNYFDDFELKAQKFKDVLMRQFTQINLRVKSLDSKISFLKYRLKLKRNTKEILVIPKSLYSVMQLLGVKKRSKRPNLEQISDDLYKALRKKEEYSENEDAFESLAEVMQFDSSNERDILEEAYRQFKYLKSVEIKFKNSQNIIDNIRRLIERETDNDDFADTVRLLFVSNKD